MRLTINSDIKVIVDGLEEHMIPEFAIGLEMFLNSMHFVKVDDKYNSALRFHFKELNIER